MRGGEFRRRLVRQGTVRAHFVVIAVPMRGTATMNVPFAPAIVINRSVPILSVSDDPANTTMTNDL